MRVHIPETKIGQMKGLVVFVLSNDGRDANKRGAKEIS